MVRSVLIVTIQVRELSSHASDPAPDHPVKRDPEPATAVRVTWVLFSKVVLQLLGDAQAIPLGDELTVPLPVPAKFAVSVRELKVAVTYRACDMVTVQVEAVPLHTPPPHPVNVSPVSGVAVRTTEVPALYSAVHNVPHEISPFSEVTRPGPNVSTYSG